MRVLVIGASTRPSRIGAAITEWFLQTTGERAQQLGVTYDLVDLAELQLPFLDEPEHPSAGHYQHEHTRAWSRRVDAVDAVIVVTPEYNYGMPATLKNAFDYLHREWAWKPIAFVSYGNTSAGTRGVQMSKQVATTLRMVPCGATVALRITDETRDGAMRPNPVRDARALGVLEEITRLATTLRPMRRTSVPTDSLPLAGIDLHRADGSDAAELLVLQRCCWMQEAFSNETMEIPALQEDFADVVAWIEEWSVWCLRDGGRLVGAVRARTQGDEWEIGRLMVAPDYAGHGIGRWLLHYAEQQVPTPVQQITLYTGARSLRNIDIYQRAGFVLDNVPVPAGVVHLSKRA
ncbi:bifunctional NAD(P)H-dependent oxidoreductase/GNAT family N-acetyltransferase [Parafrigoribacterium mesophilum]